MSRKNRRLVIDEPVEFEKYSVEVGDCRKITNHLEDLYNIPQMELSKTGRCQHVTGSM